MYSNLVQTLENIMTRVHCESSYFCKIFKKLLYLESHLCTGQSYYVVKRWVSKGSITCFLQWLLSTDASEI